MYDYPVVSSKSLGEITAVLQRIVKFIPVPAQIPPNGVPLRDNPIPSLRMKRTLMAALASLALLVPARAQQADHSFALAKAMEIFNSLFTQLDLFYVDTLDTEELATIAIDAMLESLDPYTEYYREEDMGDLKMLTTGKYGGIGSIIHARKDSTVIISEPYEGMPAAQVGLQVGDVLLRIDDEDLKGKGVSEVSDMLRGEPGTTFKLRVQRPGEKGPRDFSITRQSVKVPAMPYHGMCAPGVGYIYLQQFTENCAAEVRKALISLRDQGAQCLVLDLRDNGGGLLSEAVDIVNLFVPKGLTIVETKGKVRSSHTVYRTDNDPLDLEIPLCVLVNGGTASAAEIVSGALQDLDRAVVVGARTFGKGLVQSPRELPYDGSLKLTTSKYYIPSGRCIQRIDYADRRKGGKGTAADSLARVFHTAAGREVRESGGITPDVCVPVDTMSEVAYYLSLDDVITDWGTGYMQRHAELPPVSQFVITDADVAELLALAKESGFHYDRLSTRSLEALRRALKQEGTYEEAEAAFSALEAAVGQDLDREFARHEDEVRRVMAMEVVKRYAFQAGTVEYSLRDDPTLSAALRVLGDPDEYARLLPTPAAPEP